VGQLYEFGPFRLDSRSESLSRDGREIHLTAKPYMTLLLLVERAGSLVSKEEILAKIWPEGFVERANLTQTIYVLRKALGDAEGQLIETVPGRGYRFTPSVQCASPPSPFQPSLEPASSWRARRLASLSIMTAAIVFVAIFGLHASAPLRTGPVLNPLAQRDYTLGRYYWSQRTIPSLNLALAYFKSALAIDPTYAQAFSGVADCYSTLGYYIWYGPQPKRYFNLARTAAIRAIQLDPNAAEGHASLAFADEFLGPSYTAEVTKEFQRSIDLDGTYASAREWYSWFLFNHGKSQEALEQMTQARNLDPLSPVINFALGNQLYFNRRYLEASAQWHFTITLEPYSAQSYYGAGLADEELGQDQLAELEFKHALSLAPNDPNIMGALAHTYVRARQPGPAQQLLLRIARMKPAPAYQIAVIEEALGEQDHAIKWLVLAKAQHDSNLSGIDIDPRMDNLRWYWFKDYN
jgi:DNA-binding winged helix-turn-helix (wHTH) protein/Tfp pilus assembly protein PilF